MIFIYSDLLDTVRHEDALPNYELKKEHDWFSMQSILRWYKCEDKLWSFLLDENTTYEKLNKFISTLDLSHVNVNATVTPTDDNPVFDIPVSTGKRKNSPGKKNSPPKKQKTK